MKSILIIICLAFVQPVFAQIEHPVKWSYAAKRTGKNEAVLFLKASIEGNWHIYSAYQGSGGPVKTSFVFEPSKDYRLIAPIIEPAPVTEFEQAFKMNVQYFEHSVIFQQKVALKTGNTIVKGKVTFMVCNNQKCLAPEDVNFIIPVK